MALGFLHFNYRSWSPWPTRAEPVFFEVLLKEIGLKYKKYKVLRIFNLNSN